MNEFSIISLGFEKIINKYQNLLNHDLFDKSNMKDYTYIHTYIYINNNQWKQKILETNT